MPLQVQAKRSERRECRRFHVPGMTLSYRVRGVLGLGNGDAEEEVPVVELSKGGLRFFSDRKIREGRRIDLEVQIPDESESLPITGVVKWRLPAPSRSYKYQVGVQFLPYGEGRGRNPRKVLEKISALEYAQRAHDMPSADHSERM